MSLAAYLDPQSCPAEPPPLDRMAKSTRRLHSAIDQRIRTTGIPYLHPQGPSVPIDLFGGQAMVEWQEEKGAATLLSQKCWSTLSPIYGRYSTVPSRKLIEKIVRLESAAGALVTDCGMQATALVQDVLVEPGSHVLMSRQVYNKTKAYLKWAAERLLAEAELVEEITPETLQEKVKENTGMVFAETYTNPTLSALDPSKVSRTIEDLRKVRAPNLRMVVDNTVATPWGVKRPLLEYPGIDVIVAAGTKAMSGEDRDMWGYLASRRIGFLNRAMDLQAMRGGVLSWRSAAGILSSLEQAEERFRRRCQTAGEIVSFLGKHSLVEQVYHPTADGYPDRKIIRQHYTLPASLLSFRIRGLSEEQTGHFADVLAMTVTFRYSLSFDGLVSKVNHHKTVSEYFTLAAEVEKQGIDRFVRLGVGLEDPRDLIASLNWALHRHLSIDRSEVVAWQQERRRQLGL